MYLKITDISGRVPMKVSIGLTYHQPNRRLRHPQKTSQEADLYEGADYGERRVVQRGSEYEGQQDPNRDVQLEHGAEAAPSRSLRNFGDVGRYDDAGRPHGGADYEPGQVDEPQSGGEYDDHPGQEKRGCQQQKRSLPPEFVGHRSGRNGTRYRAQG